MKTKISPKSRVNCRSSDQEIDRWFWRWGQSVVPRATPTAWTDDKAQVRLDCQLSQSASVNSLWGVQYDVSARVTVTCQSAPPDTQTTANSPDVSTPLLALFVANPSSVLTSDTVSALLHALRSVLVHCSTTSSFSSGLQTNTSQSQHFHCQKS